MISKKIVVSMSGKNGAEPIALLVQTANKCDSTIRLAKDNKTINAKSIMGAMAMGIVNGDEIEITAEGKDEESALKAIEDFLTR